ncbi:alpha/beta hydrolase family protein [Sphingomonas sp. PB4P5]|uniref:alpha/beta hydrolase family protein n=1 Tax=Parasphingomonas puruogangriensis TaxID=3096155 RepID=UPI002FC65321
MESLVLVTVAVGATAASWAGAQTAAKSPADIAKAFGAREGIQDISLSPDGRKVAIIKPDGPRASVLTIGDLTTGASAGIMRSSGDPEKFRYCRWTTNTRIVCRISLISDATGQLAGFTRLIAIDADGKNFKMLTQTPSSRATNIMQYGGDIIDWTGNGQEGSVLMLRSFIADNTIGTRLANSKEGGGVDRVDTISLQRQTIEQPRVNATDYISDGLGAVRVMGILSNNVGGYMGDKINYSYRKAGERAWQPLGNYAFGLTGGTGFNPQAVDPKLNAVYAFDDAEGRRVLTRVALDGSLKRDIVVARPDVDVDDVIRIGRQQRVVGASYANESRSFVFFDPELDRLSRSLGKALPQQPLVRFTDATTDERQLLLQAGSDDNPGTYYLFDKASKKLEEVLPARPELAGIALGKMTAITYKAADGTVIPGYLTLPAGSNGKGLPAIVMPHGGPGSRDEWGFDWLAQFFAARGFAVLQPNFRGSAGYGEAWFKNNGFQSWRTAVGDVNDGGRWLQSQGIAAPGKLAAVGWSYGGYAALQSAALDADLFKAIVAIAPVTDLDTLRNESRLYANFPIVDRFIGSGTHVVQGSPARHAAAIKAPVLLFHGNRDMNVGVGQSRLMADRLRDAGKTVEYVEFKGLDHQLDDSAARAQMLEKSDAFLRKALGM